MKVGILCAGDRESAPFLPMLEGDQIIKKAMLQFHEGRIEETDVVVLYSGVCKVNAAIAAQILIDTFECDAIINAGTAGGMDAELEIFDTVISTETAYHDVDQGILTEFHPWLDSIYFQSDEKLLKAAKKAAEIRDDGHKIVFGRMVTGEKFIEDEKRDEINAKYAPQSVDMETASIAHVCYVNNVPFISVRTITDTADHSGVGEFEKNCDIAAGISAELVKEILREMKQEKISLCGDDCSVCPRYNANTDEELKQVAELWFKVGWRDRVVSNEKIKCTGCSMDKKCVYQLIECVEAHDVQKCNQCNEFPCEKTADVLRISKKSQKKCKEICSEQEYEVLEKAFFEKEENFRK